MNSNLEFYQNYLNIRDLLTKQGWKEGKPKREEEIITSTFTKDGYSIFVVYGCEEDVKREVL